MFFIHEYILHIYWLKVKTMKLRYFSLFMVILIMFSLGAVVASENVALESSSLDDSLAVCDNHDSNELSNGLSESQDLKFTASNDVSNDSVDLTVKINAKSVFVNNKFNRAGSKLPWTITAIVDGGIAQNTKVYTTFTNNMEYVSHNASIGVYDPISGIWDIGDLSSSDNASLTVLTKLKTDGKFVVTANATTDSNDIKLSNNYKSVYTKSGSSQVTSNTTETSDDKGGANHDTHQASENSGLVDVERGDKTSQDSSNTDSIIRETKSKEDKNSESHSAPSSSPASSSDSTSGSNIAFVEDTLSTVTNQISNTFESVSNSIISIFNPDSSANDDSDSNASSSSVSKAIAAQDFTKIPLIIFALFLIITLPIVAYDKIKS